jgi:hypothetical protein
MAQREQALQAVRTGEVNSIRAAHRAYDIPEYTLRARPTYGTPISQEAFYSTRGVPC